MGTRVSVDLPKRWGEKQRLLKEQTERQLKEELAIAKGEIGTRTAAGVDVNGKGFEPYSKLYAAERELKGKNSSPVDLTVTGTMLRNIQTRIERTTESLTGIMFFLGGRPEPDGGTNAEIAAKLQSGDFGFSKKKPRKFFALSDKQVREIISNIRKVIKL